MYPKCKVSFFFFFCWRISLCWLFFRALATVDKVLHDLHFCLLGVFVFPRDSFFNRVWGLQFYWTVNSYYFVGGSIDTKGRHRLGVQSITLMIGLSYVTLCPWIGSLHFVLYLTWGETERLEGTSSFAYVEGYKRFVLGIFLAPN